MWKAIISIGLLLAATNADAYVGPGLGVGVIGALFGTISAIFLAIVAIVWYPLKRLFRLKKKDPEGR